MPSQVATPRVGGNTLDCVTSDVAVLQFLYDTVFYCNKGSFLLLLAEGEAALEPVPSEVKTPRAGGHALGCVASILSVLRRCTILVPTVSN